MWARIFSTWHSSPWWALELNHSQWMSPLEEAWWGRYRRPLISLKITPHIRGQMGTRVILLVVVVCTLTSDLEAGQRADPDCGSSEKVLKWSSDGRPVAWVALSEGDMCLGSFESLGWRTADGSWDVTKDNVTSPLALNALLLLKYQYYTERAPISFWNFAHPNCNFKLVTNKHPVSCFA